MDEKLQRLLGEAARAARLRLGLTQAEVAKKVRLKSGVYGRVERGMMMPSVPTLRRMCETLGISSDVLLPLVPRAQEGRAPHAGPVVATPDRAPRCLPPTASAPALL